MKSGLPRHMQEIIEAKVCLTGELPNLFVKHLLGMGRSSYSKKYRQKNESLLQVCKIELRHSM